MELITKTDAWHARQWRAVRQWAAARTSPAVKQLLCDFATPPVAAAQPAICHVALVLFIAIENFVAYEWLVGDAQGGGWGRLLCTLLVRQSGTMMVAAVLLAAGVLAFTRAQRRLWKPYLLLVFILNAYLLLDQVMYKVMFGHLSITMVESSSLSCEEATKMLGSLLAETDMLAALNLFLLVASTWWQLRCTAVAPSTAKRTLPAAVVACGALMMLVGLVGDRQNMCIPAGEAYVTVADHALVTLLRSAFTWRSAGPPGMQVADAMAQAVATSAAAAALAAAAAGGSGVHPPAVAGNDMLAQWQRLRDAEGGHVTLPLDALPALRGARQAAEDPEARGQRLANATEAVRSRRSGRPPHVIMITLESVGGLQLLDEHGTARPQVTPHIAALQRTSITFPRILSAFANTVKSHVSVQLGGPVSTQGNTAEQFPHRYTGPALLPSLHAANYTTGLFASSDLQFEGLDTFLRNQGYSTFHHFGLASKQFRKEHYLNSWGGDDHSAADLLADWVIAKAKSGEQAFAHFLPDATHHPYSVPHAFPLPLRGQDPRQTRYLNSLHYTDMSIGRIVQALKAAGLEEETVFIVTGDHGEAFGDRHARNVVHGNFLYEENLRSFLMVADPASLQESVVSQRYGCIGDIYPTIASLLLPPAAAASLPAHQHPAAHTHGQDLLSPAYQQRVCYFLKSSAPPQWGLMDARWKFIANQHHAELYDLQRDPRERENLALAHPERVALYHRLSLAWFNRTHCAYVSQLEGFDASRHCSSNTQ